MKTSKFWCVLFVFSLLIVGEHALSQVASHFTRSLEQLIKEKPKDIPSRQKMLIGEYVYKEDTVHVMEQGAALHILTKRLRSYRLFETGDNLFEVGKEAFQGDSVILFIRNPHHHIASFAVGKAEFKRLMLGGEDGETFKIAPLKLITALREEALNALPPQEKGDFLPPDLIDVGKLDPTIKLDIRYATSNNFMGEVFYSQPKAFLQRPAAEALFRAHRALKKYGYGILIHDAYRPWYVTKMFWDATPDDKKIFVADPAKGSRHNRGCAVDVSLYDLATGKPVEMVSGYDEFSDRAFPQYPGGTSLQRWHRELLRMTVEAEGFNVYDWEWWHFDYKDWKQYPIGNIPFERIH